MQVLNKDQIEIVSGGVILCSYDATGVLAKFVNNEIECSEIICPNAVQYCIAGAAPIKPRIKGGKAKRKFRCKPCGGDESNSTKLVLSYSHADEFELLSL